MEADEAGTLMRLNELRSELFDPATAKYGGRIFKTTGDGALAEFQSVVDAVQCAVEIQRALAEAIMQECYYLGHDVFHRTAIPRRNRLLGPAAAYA